MAELQSDAEAELKEPVEEEDSPDLSDKAPSTIFAASEVAPPSWPAAAGEAWLALTAGDEEEELEELEALAEEGEALEPTPAPETELNVPVEEDEEDDGAGMLTSEAALPWEAAGLDDELADELEEELEEELDEEPCAAAAAALSLGLFWGSPT